MNVQTHFDQAHCITAAKLDCALTLMDEGNLTEARALIAEVQHANQEQADVIDSRIHDAIRRLCKVRKIDSRRFFAMQQALGLREIVRSLLIGHCPDLIAQHLPIENDFFAHMLGAFPRDIKGRTHTNEEWHAKGEYRNGNERQWALFCLVQKMKEAKEVQA